MSTHAKFLLAAILAMLVAGFAWLFATLSSGGSPGTTGGAPGRGTGAGVSIFDVAPEARGEAIEREQGSELVAVDADGEGPRVVHPLWVELSLMRPMGEVHAEGADPRGTGATAGLRGSVVGSGGEGIQAEVRFIAGANEGRALESDLTGAFGAGDLYPGLSIVSVEGAGFPGAEREVRLRRRETTLLHIGYARPTSIYGAVIDTDGKPISGARVRIDGQEVLSDELGEFNLPRVAAGKALALVHKSGYARHREVLHLAAGQTVPRGKLQFVLREGADLELRVRQPVGSRGAPAMVYVLPSNWRAYSNARGQRTYPWHLVSPVELYTSGSTLIEDLPAGRVHLRIYHAGAAAQLSAVHLKAGKRNQHTFELKPTPMLRGKVTLDGRPVSRARVSLEAPDRIAATLKALGEPVEFLETAVMPHLPPAWQTVETDARGRFELAPWYEVTATRYLTVEHETQEGEFRTMRVIRSNESEVELALEPAVEPIAAFRLALPVRELVLPVKVVVDGTPRDPLGVRPGDDLRVEGLLPGEWRVRVRWREQILLDDELVDLAPEGSLAVELPLGAVEGQSREERIRSGLEERPADRRFK